MVCLAKDGAQASSSLFRKGDFDSRTCSGRSPDPGDRNVFLHGVGPDRSGHFDRTSGNRGTAEPGAAGPRDSKLILQRAIFSLGCNGLYALYLGAQGVLGCSAWLLSLSGFYTLLAMMRFCVLLSMRSGTKTASTVLPPFVQRTTGALLIVLSAVLACVIGVALRQTFWAGYDSIPMISIATYTFGKAGVAVGSAVGRRNTSSALDRMLCRLRFAEIAASVFTLQQSMLATFGSLESARQHLMNRLTGTGVCLFVLGLGILTIFNSRKEKNDGKIKIGKSKRKNCRESDRCL